jgi:hypothetical protein
VLQLQCDLVPGARVDCTAQVNFTTAGVIQRLTLRLESGDDLVITGGKRVEALTQASHHLHVADMQVSNGLLSCEGKVTWLRHPQKAAPANRKNLKDLIRASWSADSRLHPEATSRTGEVLPGLRQPQLGALHALAAHWTVDLTLSLVVLPTGTGKTEVMLASLLMRRPKCLLVLVPTDPLREQTFLKFVSLGVLPECGVSDPGHRYPLVGKLLRAPKSTSELDSLRGVNVIISTVAMVQRLLESELDAFLSCFDTVFFDEAHHLPAVHGARSTYGFSDGLWWGSPLRPSAWMERGFQARSSTTSRCERPRSNSISNPSSSLR